VFLAGLCICFISEGILAAVAFPAVPAAWLLLCPGPSKELRCLYLLERGGIQTDQQRMAAV